MSIDSYGRLNVDLDSDLENYRGLDEIITINPTHMSDEEKNKFLQLSAICPNLKVIDDLKNKYGYDTVTRAGKMNTNIKFK